MPACQDEERRDEEIDRQRERREAVDLAGRRGRAVEQAADQEGRGEREAGERVEHVGAERLDRVEFGSRQRPQRAEHDRRDREPGPQPEPGQREGGRGDDSEVDIERPVIRLGGRHQHRRQISADHAQTGERGTMKQSGGQSQQSHGAKQNEGGRRRQKSVERICGVHRGIGNGGAGGSQNAWNMRRRQTGQSRQIFPAPRPFANGDQNKGEQGTENDADAGTDQALLDRVAHQKYAAERERYAADPYHPAGAEPFLEADRLRRQRRGRRCRRRRD